MTLSLPVPEQYDRADREAVPPGAVHRSPWRSGEGRLLSAVEARTAREA